MGRHNGPKVTFRALSGREWQYRGKKGRVLELLAVAANGITQWDCLPWHTRLGGTIHAMRQDDLAIETEREGPYRHARYRLRIAGTVTVQPVNTGQIQ